MRNSQVPVTSKNVSQVLPIQRKDVERYIATYRYGENCNGENGCFNCWGLLRDVQAQFFGIDLPLTSLGDPMADLYESRMKTGDWQIVDQPFHGAGVLMRDGEDPHCGVYLDFDGGGVLHCERGIGVRWHKMADLRVHGYSRLKFYRFDNNG